MHNAIKQLNIKHKTPPPPHTNFQITSYYKENILYSEVNSAIKSHKNKRYPGYDNI